MCVVVVVLVLVVVIIVVVGGRFLGAGCNCCRKQGGSCWAFAATAVLESHIVLSTGAQFYLSTQELVSCVPNPKECGGTGHCAGATAEIAYDFVANPGNGIVQEWQFGYQSYNGAKVNCTVQSNEK